MLYKVGIATKVVVLAVLKHQYAIVLQQSFLKYQSRYRWQFLQCVRRVGKDKVELLFARLDIAEHIAAQGQAYVGVQLLQAVCDKPVMVAVHLYAHHVFASARHQFERYAACAGEEVKSRSVFKINVTLKDGVIVPRRFEDYEVTVNKDLPAGVTLIAY